jgi:hypothetical protein
VAGGSTANRDENAPTGMTEKPVVDVEYGERVKTQTASTRTPPHGYGKWRWPVLAVSNGDWSTTPRADRKKIDRARFLIRARGCTSLLWPPSYK